MPLLKARPGAIPEEHGGCERDPCLNCKAETNLTLQDWQVLDFYRLVADQVENLTPMGVKDGPPWLALKLTELEAACRIYGVEPDDREWLIDMTRWLHNVMIEQTKPRGVHLLSPEELEPPEWPSE